MAGKTLTINRAPVLALWGTVVARRLGFDEDEALSLSKTMTGLNAQAKGRALGIYKPSEHDRKQLKRGDEFRVELCGRPVPAKKTDHGVRAVTGDKVVEPDAARQYLEKKFGDDLGSVRKAMEELAGAFEPEELEDKAFGLYESFRPQIPPGTRGWGAKGELSLQTIRSLAKEE